jgi:PKD repeat protein
VITTVAGTGVPGFSGDTGQAALAQLNLAVFGGVAADAAGNVYIADRNNNRVRKVATVPPTASFTADPSSGEVPLTVDFDASASTHPSGAIVSYAWDFGDTQAGAGVIVSHTYTAAGSFMVTLTVTAASGAVASASQTITVEEAAPPAPEARCGGLVATIVGTPGPDQLSGTPARDVIHGLGGNDVINGRGGNDVICGGAGNDRLRGGAGGDLLNGGPGTDIARGGAGNDTCPRSESKFSC